MAAKTSKNGTTWPNTPAGVDSRRPEPTTAPTTAKGAQRRSQGAWPASSGRDANADPGQQVTRATMLVTLATRGERPAASRAGYEINEVMPPAVPTVPATVPAPRSRRMSAVEVTVLRA